MNDSWIRRPSRLRSRRIGTRGSVCGPAFLASSLSDEGRERFADEPFLPAAVMLRVSGRRNTEDDNSAALRVRNSKSGSQLSGPNPRAVVQPRKLSSFPWGCICMIQLQYGLSYHHRFANA